MESKPTSLLDNLEMPVFSIEELEAVTRAIDEDANYNLSDVSAELEARFGDTIYSYTHSDGSTFKGTASSLVDVCPHMKFIAGSEGADGIARLIIGKEYIEEEPEESNLEEETSKKDEETPELFKEESKPVETAQELFSESKIKRTDSDEDAIDLHGQAQAFTAEHSTGPEQMSSTIIEPEVPDNTNGASYDQAMLPSDKFVIPTPSSLERAAIAKIDLSESTHFVIPRSPDTTYESHPLRIHHSDTAETFVTQSEPTAQAIQVPVLETVSLANIKNDPVFENIPVVSNEPSGPESKEIEILFETEEGIITSPELETLHVNPETESTIDAPAFETNEEVVEDTFGAMALGESSAKSFLEAATSNALDIKEWYGLTEFIPNHDNAPTETFTDIQQPTTEPEQQVVEVFKTNTFAMEIQIVIPHIEMSDETFFEKSVDAIYPFEKRIAELSILFTEDNPEKSSEPTLFRRKQIIKSVSRLEVLKAYSETSSEASNELLPQIHEEFLHLLRLIGYDNPTAVLENLINHHGVYYIDAIISYLAFMTSDDYKEALRAKLLADTRDQSPVITFEDVALHALSRLTIPKVITSLVHALPSITDKECPASFHAIPQAA